VAKTIQKVRAEGKADRKVLADEAFQRRLKARLLLFGKGCGMQKNLSNKERLFVRSVAQECYQGYLVEYHTGKVIPGRGHCGKKYTRLTRRLGRPMSRYEHRRRWYGSQKKRWIHYDVPNMMNLRFDSGDE
jgi:hypothetical protein